VFENEPNVPAELLALDNVVLRRVGSATWQTRQAMADLAFGNLEAHFAGRPPLSPVPPSQHQRAPSVLAFGQGVELKRPSLWTSQISRNDVARARGAAASGWRDGSSRPPLWSRRARAKGRGRP
jgi:hypothetical protein